MATLIDSHGPTHGLRVDIDNGDVTIWNWAELCEPDHDGNTLPRCQTMIMTLRECLVHAAQTGVSHDSQRARIIAGAIQFLSTDGGTDYDMHGKKPCDVFGQYVGPRVQPVGLTDREYRITHGCEACGAAPTNDAGEALAYPPC